MVLHAIYCAFDRMGGERKKTPRAPPARRARPPPSRAARVVGSSARPTCPGVPGSRGAACGRARADDDACRFASLSNGLDQRRGVWACEFHSTRRL
jgi:hypothetical protein